MCGAFQNNADVNAADDVTRRTALMFAAESTNGGRVVERLLDAGADPEARDSGGRTALLTAAEAGRAGAVEALVEAGDADLQARDAAGRSCLFLARDRLDLVRQILSMGEATVKREERRNAKHGLNVNFF